MTRPALVLVHGAQHDSRCWEPTVAELERQAPDLRVLAVDLPGRGGTPGDLSSLTIDDCVTSVLEQVEKAGLQEVVVVGHSLAGLTVPGVVTRLGAARVRRLVLVAACVPPQGGSVLDTLAGPMRTYARRAAARGLPAPPMPRALATWAFCNGMTAAQRRHVLGSLCAEATRPTAEPVDRTGLPQDVPRTWVLTRRDRSLRPRRQRQSIEALGGVEEVLELDACHDVMVSHPAELAGLLAARCPVDVVDVP
ncbi:MAG: putative hydrolase, alpha/beta fold family protein [Frankiales bacterium]|nr:putative hydrolase, alpha/beta fold family protein [Frankiales bacterium]